MWIKKKYLASVSFLEDAALFYKTPFMDRQKKARQ